MKTKDESYEAIKSFLEENEDVFTKAIEELNWYNGYLGDDEIYSMDELDEIFVGTDATYLLHRAFFGHDGDNWTLDSDGDRRYAPFNPMREYFYFNGYGNLVSTDWKDYSDYLDDNFVMCLITNGEHLDIDEELKELIDEYNRL